MWQDLIASGVLGCIGGLVRGSIALFKALNAKMEVQWAIWLYATAISGMIGILTGIVFSFDPRLSILAGYAGLDLLDGIYKSFKQEKVIVRTEKG